VLFYIAAADGVSHLKGLFLLRKVVDAKVFKKFLMFYGIGKFDFFVYRNQFYEVTFYLIQYLPHVWTFQDFSSLKNFRLTLCTFLPPIRGTNHTHFSLLDIRSNITIFVVWATNISNKVKSMWTPTQSCALRRIITDYSHRNCICPTC
jgi:hypothetical protein